MAPGMARTRAIISKIGSPTRYPRGQQRALVYVVKNRVSLLFAGVIPWFSFFWPLVSYSLVWNYENFNLYHGLVFLLYKG